jgi:PAS domain S-box-containing protein
MPWSTDAVISIDLDARVRHWNAGAERLYGYTAGEAVGRTLSHLTGSTEAPRDRVERMLAGELTSQYETRRRRKDGAVIDVLLTISPWTVDGRVVGVTGIALDLTQRKQAERCTGTRARHASTGAPPRKPSDARFET